MLKFDDQIKSLLQVNKRMGINNAFSGFNQGEQLILPVIGCSSHILGVGNMGFVLNIIGRFS